MGDGVPCYGALEIVGLLLLLLFTKPVSCRGFYCKLNICILIHSFYSYSVGSE